MRLTSLVLLVTSVATAKEPCEAPRLHETAPLATAAAQDLVLGQAFQRAGQLCASRSEDCDRARLECTGMLSAVVEKQAGVDEGMWLRDMLLPYLGQSYPTQRVFGAFSLATDGSCNVDTGALTAAGRRRLDQASRREAMLAEYTRYRLWANAAWEACKRRSAPLADSTADASVPATEATRAHAAAVAAAEVRRLAEEAARDDARRVAEAAAAKAQEERKRQDEAEARAREEKLAAEERARKERVEAEARARDERRAEKRAAEEKARRAEEEKALAARTQTVTALRAEKARLLSEAELAYRMAVTREEAKRRAAVEAVSVNPATAQGAVAEAAQAERARDEAERQLAEARLKAERLEVDDSFERSRGHLGLMGGGGAMGWTDASSVAVLGPGIGLLATAHVGFWAPAPLRGLASGFEVALGARLFKPFASGATPLELEGHATARYFFGALGVGLAGEFRVADARFGVRPLGGGLGLGVAMVDSPSVRVLLSGRWLPLGTAVDLARVAADLEVSWSWFTLRVTGGAFTQGAPAPSAIGWQAGVFAGARLRW